MAGIGDGQQNYGKNIARRYCITATIGQGAMGTVFRGFPFNDPSDTVAIKVIQGSRKLDSESLMRFQKEAALMSRLHHSHIISFHELGLLENEDPQNEQSGYYIVMEFAEGLNLKQLLERDGRKDVSFFFDLGLQIASALDYTHGKNIIHRDIKSQNIIVQTSTNQGVMVKVLDFGVARLQESIFSTDQEPIAKQLDVAGTPLYMAPEQSALMTDAPIDHRVDLYSLGCVLYEVLTGRPPFVGNTREKLEKQHVQVEPEPLTNLRPDIPKAIESIVHKLLAKHPNDRYQTAFGLQGDLIKARHEFERLAKKTINPFKLGMKDNFRAVSAQLDLIGRKKEMTKLFEEYRAASNEKARSRLTVITGAPGIGKTRLIAEIRKSFANRQIRFIAGSFSQHETALPFNALANAFNEYLFNLLRRSLQESQELQHRLKTVLGPTGHQIAAIVPGLKPYLKNIPEDESTFDLDGEDFNTFAKLFSDFTRCLVPDNQAIVFIFDDLHWADERSMALIDLFFSMNNAQRFYLIVSMTPSRAHHNSRLAEFITKFSKLKRRYQEIDLDPLDEESTAEIVKNMLGSRIVDRQLLQLVYRHSLGNPMQFVELVRTMVAEDLITQGETGLWKFAGTESDVRPNLTSSIDIVLNRLEHIEPTLAQILGIAAAAGLTFSPESLAIGPQPKDIDRALQAATAQGYIFRSTSAETQKHLSTNKDAYRFVHKKVRDAIYDMIPIVERSPIHRSLAAVLDSQPHASEGVFPICHHLNVAYAHIANKERKLAEMCLKYNLLAAEAALQTESWHSAEQYFENAAALLAEWTPPLTSVDEQARILEKLGDLAIKQQEPGVALQKYQELLRFQLKPLAHGRVAYKIVYLQTVAGLLQAARQLAESTLIKLRHALPVWRFKDQFVNIVLLILDALPIRKEWKPSFRLLSLAHHKGLHNSSDVEYPVIRILSIGQWLFLMENFQTALAYHLQAYRQGWSKRGNAEDILMTVADRAALLALAGIMRPAYSFFEAAYRVAKSLKSQQAIGYIALMRAICLEYPRGRIDDASDRLRKAIELISDDQQRLTFALALEFKVFLLMQKCRLDRIQLYTSKLPRAVPTRNWISPRVVAMTMFASLLQNNRDKMIRRGEAFIKRREQVGGREGDTFVSIIRCLVDYARGDIDRARKDFKYTVRGYFSLINTGFIFPFEEDILSLFLVSFNDLFLHEFGHRLLRPEDQQLLLLRIEARLQSIGRSQRSFAKLVLARIGDLRGAKNSRAKYYQAIEQAKAGNNALGTAFGYFWLTMYQAKRKEPGSQDLLQRSRKFAEKHGLIGLAETIDKIGEKAFGQRTETSQAIPARESDVAPIFNYYPSDLIIAHLQSMATPQWASLSFENRLGQAFLLLEQTYAFDSLAYLALAEQGEPDWIWTVRIKDTLKSLLHGYLLPYGQLRSSLFLPCNDAPWLTEEMQFSEPDAKTNPLATPVADLTEQATVTDEEAVESEGTVISNAYRPEPTVKSEAFDGPETIPAFDSSPNSADTSTDRFQMSKNQESRAQLDALKMSAILPALGPGGKLGLIYIENIIDKLGRDSVLNRFELDRFAAQVRSIATSPEGMDGFFAPGNFSLEPCPWLHFEPYGTMRKNRETAFFLGFRINSEQYLMSYVLVAGDDLPAQNLGGMLWYHLLSMRSLSAVSGQNMLELSEVREEISGIIKSGCRIHSVHNVSVAFSLFSRSRAAVASGHFGRARPVVLGAENRLTAHNQVVTRLSNGRDIRYWETEALLDSFHPYVLSYDTSRLESLIPEGSDLGTRWSLVEEKAQGMTIHGIISKLVMEENLPRYYLAIAFCPGGDLTINHGAA